LVVTAWLIWSVVFSAFIPRQDAGEPALTFTRPTIVATPLEQPVTFWHQLAYEDNQYMFVSRHYGNGGKHVPGFFVYSKSRGAWIQISRLSTEHARLGRSPQGPPVLAVGWDYGRLFRHEYVAVPLDGGSFIDSPDRMVAMPRQGLYRLEFNSELKVDYSQTWFWVRIADLEAAFDGRRRATPESATTSLEGAGAPVSVEVGPLLIAGLRPPDGGPTLACLVDSTSPVTYVDAGYFKDRLSGDRVTLELDPGAVVKDQRVTISHHLIREDRSFGAVLGVPFLRTLTVSIDYDRGRMYLADPKALITGVQVSRSHRNITGIPSSTFR
jgi:hypothetical protein